MSPLTCACGYILPCQDKTDINYSDKCPTCLELFWLYDEFMTEKTDDYGPCDYCGKQVCTCANCGHSYSAHDKRQDSLACDVINYPGITPDFTGTTKEACGCEHYVCQERK